MNMTKIGEHDWKVGNDKREHGELDRKYNKYYHNDEHEQVNMTENHVLFDDFNQCYYKISKNLP